MRYLFSFLGFVFTISLPSTVFAGNAEGYWLTQNGRSVIHTYECDQGLCGTIHWITEGGMEHDTKNPVVKNRKRPMCGLMILWGFEKDGDDWDSGKIYKADDGDIYSANIELKDTNTLSLRGYIGIPLFGKSQEWKRVSANDYKACVVP